MAKVAVVFYTQTGNTEVLANAVENGALSAGAEVDVLFPSQFGENLIEQYDAIAFGCPASGAEQLEENEFAPMWEEVKNKLDGKKIMLFGSYGWGGGEFMDFWKEDVASGELVGTVIAREMPTEEDERLCEELSAKLAK